MNPQSTSAFQSLYPDINPAHSPPYNLGTHLHGTCRRNIFLWSHLWRSHHCRSRTWTGSFHDHRVFTKTSRKIRTEAKKSIPQRTMGRNTSQCQRHHRRKQHILQQACRFFPPSLFGFFPAHTRYGIAVALLHANNSPPVDVDKPPNDQATLKRRNLANNNRLDRAVHVA
ncbi:hypothetical protein FRC0293_00503 [Corynebacterium diphtheriae]|nr:hypothetical protein FRC0293_00503 [Corynebacterium diphtheriae]CAB0834693.1 hypothetical protein FRC0294_00505 [Corynebacterium diphtheriae]